MLLVTYMTSLSTYDVAKIIGVSRSTIQQIVDRGIYVASIEEADGKGTKNQFSREDVYRLAVILELNKLNVSQKIAAEIAKNIDWSYPPKPKLLYFEEESPGIGALQLEDFKARDKNIQKPTTVLFIERITTRGNPIVVTNPRRAVKNGPFILAYQTESQSRRIEARGGKFYAMMDIGPDFTQQYDEVIDILKAKK